MRVQREVRVTGNGEVVDGEGIEHFGCLNLRRYCSSAADLCKAVGNEEDEDDQSAVGRPFDLKVPEQ